MPQKQSEGGKPYVGKQGVKCNHCGRNGHKESECHAKIAHMQHKANQAVQEDIFDATKALSYTASSHCLSASANTKCPLILDSGATDHIFPSIEHFSDYTTSVPLASRFTYTADDKPHEVKGQGTVTLQLNNGVESKTVRLEALHVPSLGQTLVSLSCINRRGQCGGHIDDHQTQGRGICMARDLQPHPDRASTDPIVNLLSEFDEKRTYEGTTGACIVMATVVAILTTTKHNSSLNS